MKRLDNAFFDKLYAESPDPWGFETKWYERRKYDLTLAALPRPRYRSAFEPGCSNGALTERLAWRTEQLLALEALEDVAGRARQRLCHFDTVEVRTGAIPDDWPDGAFDLVVFSEVAYYLTEAGLSEALDRLAGSLAPGGHALAVHFRGSETNYPLTAEAVHRQMAGRPQELQALAHYEEADFLLDVYERRP